LARSGFTLIELMVGVVIMGLLTTALWQLVRAQSSFVAFESQREDVQENGRAALEIIAGDARAVLPQGLLVARDTVLVMALPKAWGVTCAATTATRVTAVFPTLSPDAFTVLGNGGTGLVVNTSATSTPAWSPRPTLAGARPTVTAAATVAASTCPTASGGVVAYQFTGTSFPVVPKGTLVALYQLVRYDAGQSDGKWWVRRSNGLLSSSTFSMSPMAGPLPARDSVSFSYYTGPTATLVAPEPGTDTTALNALSRIKLKVVTISSSGYRGTYSRSRDSAVVLLRNRVRAVPCATGAPAPC
jgi:prepilin-type N-terminal cleavage/methylation domain-containing protein